MGSLGSRTEECFDELLEDFIDDLYTLCISNAPALSILFSGLLWYLYIEGKLLYIQQCILVHEFIVHTQNNILSLGADNKNSYFKTSTLSCFYFLYFHIDLHHGIRHLDSSTHHLHLALLRRPRPSAKSPSNLVGHVDLDPQFFSKRPDQTRILLEHPPDDSQIETLLEQLLRLLAAGDGPDGANGHLVAQFLFDGSGERCLVARARLDLLFGVVPATAYV